MMTGVSFALFLLGFDYAELLIISALYSFFWNAILSQFEAYTLDSLAENSSVYSKIRMWGSIGFITLALILGRVFEWYGLSLLPLIMLSLIGLAFITSVNLSETPGAVLVNQDERESIIPLLKNKGVVSFLLVCLFMQISHGPYYSFYSLYMKGFGYSSGYIGFLWAFGVISEVILFWFFPKLLKRFAVYFLLQASILLSVIRWLLISMFPEQPGLILLAQALHAFSFGCLHVVSMVYVQRFFSKGFSGRGQALYSGVSYGLGGAIGAYLSGFLWEEVGHTQLFQVAALFSVLAAAFAVGLRGVGKN
jgi:PPP family 3-phenylpropionic acid transporter